jgi:dihydroorotate dehydrogenase (fumarate)
VNIPVAVKLNPFLSSIPYTLKSIQEAGAKAVVLFNRFYQPNIDLKNLTLVLELKLSTSDELRLRLRWAGIVFNKIDTDIGITGGVHTAEDVLKCLAAGANIAMMTSALMKNGIEHLKKMNAQIGEWLEERGYDSVMSFTGIMSETSTGQHEAYTRANYLKMIGL